MIKTSNVHPCRTLLHRQRVTSLRFLVCIILQTSLSQSWLKEDIVFIFQACAIQACSESLRKYYKGLSFHNVQICEISTKNHLTVPAIYISIQEMKQLCDRKWAIQRKQIGNNSTPWKQQLTPHLQVHRAERSKPQKAMTLNHRRQQPVDTHLIINYIWALSFPHWNVYLVKQGSAPMESPWEWILGPQWTVPFLFIYYFNYFSVISA